MVQAIVQGAAGKMGRRLVAVLHEAGGFTLKGALERPGADAIGKDAGELAGIGPVGVSITEQLESLIAGAQVIFDFSSPPSAMAALRVAAERSVAMVIGTTGFSPEQDKEVESLAHRTRVVKSPNMSLGVNVLYRILEKAVASLGEGYDVEIVEMHHRLKKDAPSGTALHLAQVVAGALKRPWPGTGIFGRRGITGERTSQEIGVHAVRGGDVVGEHLVVLAGPGERLELVHRAHSRDTFAWGAVRAALWLLSKPPGLYDMEDVLGLKP
ncbi:MAG TPA: 4-hydroxy-tetrahydrodipicolinate reductase [bacterium]|nr:4-hydroxy-tetrahydrodipicolinate reductase [bacterium]